MHIGQIFSQSDIEQIAKRQGEAASPQWWDIVGKFREAATRLDSAYNQMRAVAQYVSSRPALRARYDALMSRVRVLRNTIASTLKQIDSGLSLIKNMVGLQGLGVIPLIAVGVVAVALAAVTKWTLDAVTFLKAVEEQKRLEAAGVPPERAAAIVKEQKAGAPGFLGDLFNTRNVFLIAGAAGLAWWVFFRRKD